MATDKQSWRVTYPVAEIHWKHTATKYGLNETESIRKYWKSSCTKESTVSLIPGNQVISITSSDGIRKLVPYTDSPNLRMFLRLGYQLTGSKFAYRRGTIGAIRLIHKDVNVRPSSFIIVCIDLEELKIQGTFLVKGHTGKFDFHDVEVYGMATNNDGNLVALSMGMVHACDFLHEAYENAVVIYNCLSMNEVYRINVGHMIAAVAFDPRTNYNQFSIAGVPNHHGIRELATYDLTSAKKLMSTSIDEFLDVDGETLPALSYSKEGGLLVLQTLEPVGYTKEWLYNTYVFSMDSLNPVARCGSNLLNTCHSQCMPIAAPLVSPCGSYMALGNYCSNQKAESPIKVFRIPSHLNLKSQCRSAILRAMSNPANVCQLHLPNSLKLYLLWDQMPAAKTPSKLMKCNCTPEIKDADTKDASWFTQVDDVTCNPEFSETPLHPRARNETYS